MELNCSLGMVLLGVIAFSQPVLRIGGLFRFREVFEVIGKAGYGQIVAAFGQVKIGGIIERPFLRFLGIFSAEKCNSF
jgi:hypothetical protein